MARRLNPWRWVVLGLAGLYFLVPLAASVVFTVDVPGQGVTFDAYSQIVSTDGFGSSLLLSLELAAATIAIVMTDIKKVLAYSTVSQLGYMFLALGVGVWAVGMFHHITHAFFHALLFLCPGLVIFGRHHGQVMSNLVGLYPRW